MDIHPEHNFTLPLTDWEQAVFDAATQFTAAGYRGRGTRTYSAFPTLPEAIAAALKDDRCYVYAVALSGRFIVLDRGKWPRWLARYHRNTGAQAVFRHPNGTLPHRWAKLLKLLAEPRVGLGPHRRRPGPTPSARFPCQFNALVYQRGGSQLDAE